MSEKKSTDRRGFMGGSVGVAVGTAVGTLSQAREALADVEDAEDAAKALFRGQSTLHGRADGKLVYDSEQNITWLADANLAATLWQRTNGALGAPGGAMDWPTAMEFATSLVFAGRRGWRLPKAVVNDPDCANQAASGTFGYRCTQSELAHLFYLGLGGKAGDSIAKTHNDNFRLFKNIQVGPGVTGVEAGPYWTSTDFAPAPVIAWNFHMQSGFQNANSKSVLLIPWPVLDGDVGASARVTEL